VFADPACLFAVFLRERREERERKDVVMEKEETNV